ncbi:sulfotransferase [Salipiger sp. 1_MG-2023]|uniref:sulfotransferase family protein n=1 Tax=Salipiger sp. 1_MG-2023 TaxID=3062665 RepID=UPI0026E35952|nr:sulfotransferase [Salipiger sp. 1_MG-2023]MDO6587039.1 sulfotransferase [Salipiger sp. 1_MG-2023]
MKSSTGTIQKGRRERIRTGFALAMMLRRNRQRSDGSPPPLFIIGSGRSGNTLVRRVLMATGAIHIPPETFVLGDIIESWSRLHGLMWREKVWLFCAHFEKHPQFADFGLVNLNDFAAEAIGLTDRSLPSLIAAFYRYLAQADHSEATRWGDKTPYNTFHLPALRAAFPDAQFLWLVRDGRDAALSYVEAGLYDDFQTAAARWVDANSACESLAQTGADVFRMSYEALVEDPEASFQDICDWAALPFEPAMLTAPSARLGDVETHAHHENVRSPISAKSVGRWKSRLSREDLAQVRGEFASMLEKMGYEPH